MTKQEVHAFLTRQVTEQLEAEDRRAPAEALADDFDLLLSGLVDSLGLLELTGALDDFCGFELDFEALDPEQLTVVGPLCEFVVSQTLARRA